MLLASPRQPGASRRLRARLVGALGGGAGPGPGIAGGRVRLLAPLPYAGYAALLCSGDVALDPFPFGGGVTTLEALSCGVPVVTAGGLQTVHRLAAGMLAHVLGDAPAEACCVARDAEEFGRKAVALAGGDARGVREALLRNASRLFDDAGSVESWERFLGRVS